jgi:hypothetical protein
MPESGNRGSAPFAPMEVRNGFLVGDPRIHAPLTDIDLSPRDYRHYVNVGATEIQLDNGLHRKIGTGLMSPIAILQDYLWQAAPIIPGQNRDNWGGFHKKGIDPQGWRNYFNAGPGSQPTNPGGPGQISGKVLVNPGTS